jgi:DNA-binding NarL/FixJ family response regulator
MIAGVMERKPMSIRITLAIEEEGIRAQCLDILQSTTGVTVELPVEDMSLTQSVKRENPDLLLLDIDDFSADEAPFQIAYLLSQAQATRVLLLTSGVDYPLILDALAAGARGYLDHTQIDGFLAKAVVKVNEGEAWVPRKMVGKILDRLVDTSFSRPVLAAVN